jgi:hypothetical protein
VDGQNPLPEGVLALLKILRCRKIGLKKKQKLFKRVTPIPLYFWGFRNSSLLLERILKVLEASSRNFGDSMKAKGSLIMKIDFHLAPCTYHEC